MTAEGANVLPARVIEDAFQNQYDKTLNYTDFKGAIQKLDKWYADRGIFGQVCFSTCLTWRVIHWQTAASRKLIFGILIVQILLLFRKLHSVCIATLPLDGSYHVIPYADGAGRGGVPYPGHVGELPISLLVFSCCQTQF